MSQTKVSLTNATVTGMADHYRKTLEILDELTDLRAELNDLHDNRPHQTKKIAQTYDAIRQLTAIAKIHAQLAGVQALNDVAFRSVVLP